MATQKNIKSKVTASKSKTSKVAPAKKTTSKSPSKAKPASGKGKPAVKTQPKAKKTTPATKAKKAAPATKSKKAAPATKAKKTAPATKSKKAAPATKAKTNKPAAKPIGKKISSKTSTPAKKAAPAPKPGQKKATPKPKTHAKAKPVKATPKVVAKTAHSLPSKPVHKPVQKAKTVPPVKSEVKAKTVHGKFHSTTLPKTAAKSTGSKISDVATKPSVSPKVVQKPQLRKETTFKPSKPFTVHSGKPIEKMSERKENKPVAAAMLPEEPQKTRYNDKELEEFDQLIDQKLIVAREQLEFYLKQLEDMAENPDNKIKGLDDGLSSLESERISSMASRQQKLIQHLENAKIRIKNKVYGICRETGKLISKERLRAVPHATLSIEAKQAQN